MTDTEAVYVLRCLPQFFESHPLYLGHDYVWHLSRRYAMRMNRAAAIVAAAKLDMGCQIIKLVPKRRTVTEADIDRAARALHDATRPKNDWLLFDMIAPEMRGLYRAAARGVAHALGLTVSP